MKGYFLDDPSTLLDGAWEWANHGLTFLDWTSAQVHEKVAEWMEQNGAIHKETHSWQPGNTETDSEIQRYSIESLRHQPELLCITAGEAILDVRSNLDRWIRIELTAGDNLVLKQGTYRRFLRTPIQTVTFVEAYTKIWAHQLIVRPVKGELINPKLKSYGPPVLFNAWLEENKQYLKPPVGDRPMWNDGEFIVMIVSGPNIRRDYHINQGEEFFYQLKGDMWLAIEDQGVFRDIPVREGEMFVLPGGVPHSPQRKANTVGLVIERRRKEGELDGLRWYCDHCGKVLKEDYFQCVSLGAQLREKIHEFYSNTEMRTCKSCGKVSEKPVDV